MTSCPNCQSGDSVRKLRDYYLEIAPPPDPIKKKKHLWDDQADEPKTLADKLAPPDEPIGDFYMATWALIPLVPFINLVFTWMAPMPQFLKRILKLSGLLLVLSIIGYFFHPASLDPAYYSIGPLNVHNAPVAVLVILLIIYYSGLLIERTRRKARFENETYPQWQKETAVWESLLYCTNCEGAFATSTEGQSRFTKADEIHAMIKR